MKNILKAIGVLALMGAAAQAAEVQKARLGDRDITLTLHSFMTVEERQTLSLALSSAEVLAIFVAGQEGYGALAVSPDDGFIRNGQISPSAIALAGLPDAKTAAKEAVAACESKTKGQSPCVLALEIAPAQ